MTCDKRRFTSRAEAKEFGASHLKQNGRQRVYRCGEAECATAGFWHLTGQPTTHIEFYRDLNARKRTKRRKKQ